MNFCLICSSSVEPFMSFGKMPGANIFLDHKEFADEMFFKLEVGVCSNCRMVQLIEFPNRELLFHKDYVFFSGKSARMTAHFKKFAENVIQNYLSYSDPFVVEIGSNDGTMLINYADAGIHHLGVEPSENVAQVAMEKGLRTINQFFDKDLAKQIVAKEGQADVVVAANVMCHIPYIHSVVEGIKILLKPSGVLIFEDPYLFDVIDKTSYDQFYGDHVFMFSVFSIKHLFDMHEMEIIDVASQVTHGGSMRYTISHKGSYQISDSVTRKIEKEKATNLDKLSVYHDFSRKCEKSREELRSLLIDFKSRGKRIVGYAASAKSTTVCNYCGITPDILDYICDTTPIKQGKYSPGMHIPVVSHERFKADYPDYALLFA